MLMPLLQMKFARAMLFEQLHALRRMGKRLLTACTLARPQSAWVRTGLHSLAPAACSRLE